MDSSTWAFLLLAIGVLLFVAEVFIPSGGAIPILALSCLLASVWCAWTAWWNSNPLMFWAFLGVMFVVTPAAVAGAFSVWQHTPLGRRAILQPPTPEDVAAFVEQGQHLTELIGKIGETVSPLNPAGIVKIAGERVQCQSEGRIIEIGCQVRVIAVQGNRVVVRLDSKGDSSSLPVENDDKHRSSRATNSTPQLDFDYPPS